MPREYEHIAGGVYQDVRTGLIVGDRAKFEAWLETVDTFDEEEWR